MILIAIGTFFYINVSSGAVISPSSYNMTKNPCKWIESDNGRNYTHNGTIANMDTGKVFYDKCFFFGRVLIEAWLVRAGTSKCYPGTEWRTCSNKCVNGACNV